MLQWRLAELCAQTHRDEEHQGLSQGGFSSMARVRKAIIYFAWLITCCTAPADDAPDIREALLTPGFDGILRTDPALLQSGGAKLIEKDGIQYFVAVGFASVLSDSPAERVRQLQVARTRALKVASEFIGTTIVTSERKIFQKNNSN
jgi:hypothetical protein